MRLDLSFTNYNVKGLHSLVLNPVPHMRRIFFTTPDHEMYDPETIALHAHHCAIELRPLFGWSAITNWRCIENRHDATNRVTLREGYQEFRYRSALREGTAVEPGVEPRRFEATGGIRSVCLSGQLMKDAVHLAAADCHTMTVARRASAAWLSTEGPEDPGYDPVVWSRRDLSKWTAEGLYQPMDADFLNSALPLPLTDPLIYAAICGEASELSHSLGDAATGVTT
jgi:hypothetical protein